MTLYPLEFFVPETPLSLQASGKSKERWKATIQDGARRRLYETDDDEIVFLDHRPLALTLYYFPPEPMVGDIDNIIKPIMDGLITVAYRDDRSIERVTVQKFEPEIDWEFANPSDQLAAALDAARPVVYIRIDDDLTWRKL